MLESYGDVIAIRHFQEGAPAEAAKWSSVPVINCGDGWGQHPTQVLTDLYTILLERGTLDGLSYLLVGDMRMRTMHSILHALSQFDAEAIVVSPPEMALKPEFKAELDDHERRVSRGRRRRRRHRPRPTSSTWSRSSRPTTRRRVSSEPVPRSGSPTRPYRVTAELMRSKAKRSSIVLHSLPRMDELTPDVDETRHHRYWIEASNGVVIRMALLALVLGAAE